MSPPARARDAAPEVSVVMPAHNEVELLEHTLTDVVEALRKRSLGFEIIVVENGSIDGTLTVARAYAHQEPAVRVLTRPVADYGEAIRAGILEARAEIVVLFDVDYYDAGFLDQVVPELRLVGGPVIVVGSKRAAGAHDTRPWPRRAITAGFGLILKFGFGLRVSDTHGMKAMRREPVDALVRCCRFGSDLFDTELVLRADRAGLAIAEVPVTVEERRPSRTPITRRILRTIFGLVRLRIVLHRERS